ncbi:hypothetical protein F5887DRAFT_612276 [Amanita rubescens]|nr:hypothetical protein F5887DRAFT_612276 [Amanita rubescens]
MPLPLLDGESDIKGCRAIVTGANTGIGYEVAKGLLLRGIGTVILACKNESKGLAAAEALRKETGREWGAVEFRHLDLSWFGSVRAFAKQYIDDKIPLHVLVHNAGVHGIGACQAFTADSLDLIMQVNHVAPLLLTLLLLPAMFGAVWRFLPPKAARVIWVTSDEAELMPFPEAVLPRPVTALCHKKRLFSPKDKLTQYATAKLLNIMCARELLERLFLQRIELKGSVRVAAAHPGRVETSLGKTDSWLGNIFRSEAASFGDWDDIVLRTPEEGAKTVLLVASYEGRKIWGQKGYSKDIQSMPVFENMEIMRAYPQLAQSRDLRKKVWTDTVRLMKLKEGEVHERYL